MAVPALLLSCAPALLLPTPVRVGRPVQMQFQWPGANGESDFFPEGGPEAFDAGAGPLRRQILANSNFVQGKLAGYQQLRPAMKRAFAFASKDGTDNGVIDSCEVFTALMVRVGAAGPEAHYLQPFARALTCGPVCRRRAA